MSANNLPHWGEVEAVKEFIQNMVFAKTILRDEISIKYENGKAIISNSPSGFNKGKLLIGESEQRSVSGAPGEYGEGTKAGMCVARRLGLSVTLQTNGFKVTPELEPSSIDSSVNSLVFYIEDNNIHTGTTVEIECSEESLQQAKSYFAVLNGIDEELLNTESIIDSISDTIYVNGVKITETTSIQSYNFTSPELMNRDRNSVNMDKVKGEVSQLISKINEVDRASVILQEIINNDELLEAQSGIQEWGANAEVWKEAVHRLYGDKVAISTGTDSDTKARYHKFNLISKLPNKWLWFFKQYLEIYTTDELDALSTPSTRASVKPHGTESTNLGWCKRLIKLYYGDYGTVKVSNKVLDQHNNECYGCYDPTTDIIWLEKSILSDKEQCFKTLLHETVHRITGASDNTLEFTRGWEEATWGILMRGTK